MEVQLRSVVIRRACWSAPSSAALTIHTKLQLEQMLVRACSVQWQDSKLMDISIMVGAVLFVRIHC